MMVPGNATASTNTASAGRAEILTRKRRRRPSARLRNQTPCRGVQSATLERHDDGAGASGVVAETAEERRLDEDARRARNWKRFGPYLAERQWGTVREDYSEHGTSWDYFPHDQARSRAYRWGEDGLCGFCDREGRLCFAVALWNGADPILKERLFGLSGTQGNHGEDVKEEYFYLDATPTHSYGKALYKYPQRAFPYADLVNENARRGRLAPEYELADTGAFDGNRYFDVFVEHAKASPDDILVTIRIVNRGPDVAPLVVLPTLWFRNTWSWGRHGEGYWQNPTLAAVGAGEMAADHPTLGRYRFVVEPRAGAGASELLFYGERDERRAPVQVSEREPLRQGRLPRRHRRRYRRRREPGAPRHEGGRGLSPEPCARRRDDVPLRVRPTGSPTRSARAIPSRASTRSWAPAAPRPTPSTPRARPHCRPTSATSCARPTPGSCGRSSSITTTCAPGSRATRRIRR